MNTSKTLETETLIQWRLDLIELIYIYIKRERERERERGMEEPRGEGRGEGWWWWAAASSAQLVAGIAAYRRGSGEGAVMPFKAFSIATLFVSAGATAVAGTLQASGIHTVDDMKEVGLRIRRWMMTAATNKQD
ncbi:hypothetical protein IHE45_16G027000 [Dioscorea alata]|uniref:Uncharacterized protein n=1 Tax=Dioscorea alata TaxID=55571 RepID=A0ACB7UGA0_DIOAL|nr:hypothetical protein IHE45_16G027000 [Dioscorea alata]